MADRRVRVTYEFRTKRQWAEVKCAECDWCVIFPAASVDRLFRMPLKLSEAEKRFRCRWCGKRAAKLRAIGWREYHG